MKRNAWILLLITLLPVMAWGQNKISVKGIVYDNYNMTIPGASVVEKGTQNGTVTDMDGNFTIQVNAGSKIEVSFIGYKTMEVTATDKQILKVTLAEDSQQLEEVVVTGYGGTQVRSKVTSAISKVNEKDLVIGIKANPNSFISSIICFSYWFIYFCQLSQFF